MHAHVQKSGWLSSVFVCSALVDFYAKLLSVNDAAMMFDEIPSKNTVCVNALLSGFAEAKMWDEVIQLVRRIPGLHLDVDNFTLSAALRACDGLWSGSSRHSRNGTGGDCFSLDNAFHQELYNYIKEQAALREPVAPVKQGSFHVDFPEPGPEDVKIAETIESEFQRLGDQNGLSHSLHELKINGTEAG
ncbi:CRAL-TRIO domain-containing protein [Forsythia ovata]|uniref:CRAL-TRIO domain-containing protein n=1 Tax=Forsythia ovata TaxID=205694 RepID=A0ABD1PX86_9LAMI